ncbi:MAG: ABC transporter permease, partial [Alphaproteobacteria bacterium]|nr:ABC transporter permease [Alphaproteobacteria bacterium]
MKTQTNNKLQFLQQYWQRFRSNRRAMISLVVFSLLFILTLFAELI